jgi:hypothetical protein
VVEWVVVRVPEFELLEDMDIESVIDDEEESEIRAVDVIHWVGEVV